MLTKYITKSCQSVGGWSHLHTVREHIHCSFRMRQQHCLCLARTFYLAQSCALHRGHHLDELTMWPRDYFIPTIYFPCENNSVILLAGLSTTESCKWIYGLQTFRGLSPNLITHIRGHLRLKPSVWQLQSVTPEMSGYGQACCVNLVTTENVPLAFVGFEPQTSRITCTCTLPVLPMGI
jgi:hypothetical protein